MFGDTSFDKYLRTETHKGYIDEYSNKEEFCHSFILIPGSSLVSEGVLCVVYLITLFYLFLGIAIISDIFMEAIEVITS